MVTKVVTLITVGLLSFALIAGGLPVADAEYDDYANRLSREHRVANEVDEWIERGSATITASPRFEDGVRLTAWENSSYTEKDYEFAIASAVYLFEIPRGAQYIEVLIRYRGEPHELQIEDYDEAIAGRVWIRNTKRESTHRGYYDENAKETRYGDTFILRAKKRSELIKIPATGHVKDGSMELHIVAEGGEQIDVEYIEVSTYHRQPKIQVIQRYSPVYRWRPWHRYTYLYFYDGPIYYATDYDYYLRWSYPTYAHPYLTIRTYYGAYLGRYRGYYPSAYYRCYSPYYRSYRGTPKVYQRRTQLNRWSKQHETTRKQYSRSRLAASTGATRTTARANIRTVLENHRRQTPATTNRATRGSVIAQKRRVNASAASVQRSQVRQRSYTAARNLKKQRRYPATSTFDANRYRSTVKTQRTRPLYRNSTSSSSRSGVSNRARYSTSKQRSSTSKQRSSTVRSSTRTSSRIGASPSRTSRTKTRAVSPATSSTSRTKTRAARSTSSTSRTRPATSSSSRSRTSSSKDDDDNRRRTTQRTKRRR